MTVSYYNKEVGNIIIKLENKKLEIRHVEACRAKSMIVTKQQYFRFLSTRNSICSLSLSILSQQHKRRLLLSKSVDTAAAAGRNERAPLLSE